MIFKGLMYSSLTPNIKRCCLSLAVCGEVHIIPSSLCKDNKRGLIWSLGEWLRRLKGDFTITFLEDAI